MYIPRHIESVVKKMAGMFPAVVLTGPCQVGKTTLLQHMAPNASYVTLDRIDQLDSAASDPERFLQAQSEPAIIDEIQYAPDLFRYIKVAADQSKTSKGRFFLTGSQRYVMMQSVDESMAGRAGIIEMLGLSFREVRKSTLDSPFIPSDAFLFSRRDANFSQAPEEELWDFIYKGDLPELHSTTKLEPSLYYASYIDTYLRRDVRDLAHVGDLAKFNRFLTLASYLHGQVLNKSDLASKAGVSFQTADRWLSVLEASNIIYLLKPFFGNTRKRLVKMPKLYFLNSGLLARLRGLTNAEQLKTDRDAGAFFEGFVLTELLKSHLNATGSFPELYYYRDSNKNEIDFVLEEGLDLYPLEVKTTHRARIEDVKAFSQLDFIDGYTRKTGGLICNASALAPLGNHAWTIPVVYL